MINWSKDINKRSIQVQTVVQMLGFEIPKNEEQMKLWDKAFEGYPYELNIDMIDLDKIWNDEAQDFDSVLHPIISTKPCEVAVCDHPKPYIERGRDPFSPPYCHKCRNEI